MGVAVDSTPKRAGVVRRGCKLVLAVAAPALLAWVCLVESKVESRQELHSHKVAMVTTAIRQQAAARGQDLRGVEMLLRPRDDLDWRMFEGLARFGLLEREDVSVCAWAPRVTARHRAEYEAFVEVSAYRSFRISERDGQGALRDAGSRDEHFPLQFVAPVESASMPLGLDLAAEPALEAAMDRARDENQVEALLTNHWVRDSGEGATVLVLVPVYRSRAPLDTVAARQVALEGFLVATVLPAPEIGAAVAESDLGELQANLANPAPRPERRLSPFDTSGAWVSRGTEPAVNSRR